MRALSICAVSSSWFARFKLKLVASIAKIMASRRKYAGGMGFLKHIRRLHGVCAAETWTRAPYLGERAPRALCALGNVQSLLDRAASCAWGCLRVDHCAEFLVGRAVGSSNAAMLLMTNGHYDEALSLIRSTGEVANLVCLFITDRALFERWKSIDDKTRRKEFRPVRVRQQLKASEGPLVIDEDLYDVLSGFAIHPEPGGLVQAHNALSRSLLLPIFQAEGFLKCINDLARTMAFVAVFAAAFIKLPDEVKQNLRDAGRELVKNIGGVNLDETERPWFSPSGVSMPE